MRLRRTLAVVGLLYCVEGFPMGVFDGVVPVWLRLEGVDLDAIGWLSLLGLAWSAKVLWSPLVDRLGERRTWISGALLVMGGALLALCAVDVSVSLGAAVAVLSAYCLASATQDVAIDAYTIGITPRGQEGPVNAGRVTAYRIGLVVGGSALLLLPRWVGWNGTFVAGAVLSLLFAAAVRGVPRVEVPAGARRETWAPLLRWLQLPAAWGVLGFVLLFRAGDIAMGPMVRPFWVDRGYPVEEIGFVTTALGSVATVAGAAVGGAFVSRFGISRGLLWLGVAAVGSNLGYAAAAAFPEAGSAGMYGASLAESFCSGLAVTAFLSFCMRITEKEHAAVQYAVLSALFVLPGKLAGGVSGQVTQALGYAAWFALSGAITVPALLLLPFARRRLAWIEAPEA